MKINLDTNSTIQLTSEQKEPYYNAITVKETDKEVRIVAHFKRLKIIKKEHYIIVRYSYPFKNYWL